MLRLSICIPTYNRSGHLRNCLESIVKSANAISEFSNFEICISNNNSTDETSSVVAAYEDKLPLVYNQNDENIGIARNFLRVVEMARGEFVWLLGDDDLLLTYSLESVLKLILQYKDVDFFYVNSSHLTTEFVLNHPQQPFDTDNLPKDLVPFSNLKRDFECDFFGLIDYDVSFDFLGGMFLSVFRRDNWVRNVSVLSQQALFNKKQFSHFDNTFPHLKVHAYAFCESRAYFCHKPLSVCLTGAREWSPMYPLVKSVRLIEALEMYRTKGLPLLQYLKCRNAGLNNFIPDLGAIVVYGESAGKSYVSPLKLLFKNCIYPNFYLSFIRFLVRKLKKKIGI